MNVLFLCDGYRAMYSGNFIPSLKELERRIEGKCVYLFDNSNKQLEWCVKLQRQSSSVEFMDFSVHMAKRVIGLLRVIDHYKIDIVHVHFGDRKLASICGVLRRNVKIIWHLHSDWSLGSDTYAGGVRQRLKMLLLDLIGYTPDVKIAVSENLAEREKGIYIPNGLAFERVWRIEDHKAERLTLKIPPSAIVVLCFGWHPEVKGVDIAVNAIAKLRAEYDYDIQLLLVTGDDTKNVRRWIDAKTSCGAKAGFIHYAPPIEDVYWYHNIADIYLSSSRSEGFSYALCEALSIAKPCVSSDIPGVSWAKEYRSIQYFESGDYSKCAEAIYEVVRSMDKKKFMCEEDSQNLRCSVNNAENWAQSVMNIYRSLL